MSTGSTNLLEGKIKTAVASREVCGAPAFDDPAADLGLHAGCSADSMFVVAHVTGDDGNTYNFLIHHGAMIPTDDGSYTVVVAMVSLTDKARRDYLHREETFPFADCEYAEDRLAIKTPATELRGTIDDMTLTGNLPDGRGSIKAHIVNQGPALQNAGAGLFPCVNDEVVFNHYGLPYLKTTGVIELDGRTIRFTGDAWLDRQWNTEGISQLMMDNRYQTKWMDLNLSNGLKVSLWDILADEGRENAWATILTPGGTQIVTPMRPLLEGESDYWESPDSGNCYPTKFVVEMPDVSARIDVAVYEGIPQQESVSAAGFNRYEAHSTCSGTFMGEDVTGFCCVEYVGNHRRAGAAAAQAGTVASSYAGATLSLDPALSGTYRTVMNSPMGKQDMALTYEVAGDSLTGTIELMGKTVPVEDGHATAEGFTHTFAMKVPVGRAKITVVAHREGAGLAGEFVSPMGTMPFTAERV